MTAFLIIIYYLGAFVFSAYEYAGDNRIIKTVMYSIIWPVVMLTRAIIRIWWTLVGFFIEH